MRKTPLETTVFQNQDNAEDEDSANQQSALTNIDIEESTQKEGELFETNICDTRWAEIANSEGQRRRKIYPSKIPLLVEEPENPIEVAEVVQEHATLESLSNIMMEMKSNMDEMKNDMDEMRIIIESCSQDVSYLKMKQDSTSEVISEMKQRNKFIYGDKIGPRI